MINYQSQVTDLPDVPLKDNICWIDASWRYTIYLEERKPCFQRVLECERSVILLKSSRWHTRRRFHHSALLRRHFAWYKQAFIFENVDTKLTAATHFKQQIWIHTPKIDIVYDLKAQTYVWRRCHRVGALLRNISPIQQNIALHIRVTPTASSQVQRCALVRMLWQSYACRRADRVIGGSSTSCCWDDLLHGRNKHLSIKKSVLKILQPCTHTSQTVDKNRHWKIHDLGWLQWWTMYEKAVILYVSFRRNNSLLLQNIALQL